MSIFKGKISFFLGLLAFSCLHGIAEAESTPSYESKFGCILDVPVADSSTVLGSRINRTALVWGRTEPLGPWIVHTLSMPTVEPTSEVFPFRNTLVQIYEDRLTHDLVVIKGELRQDDVTLGSSNVSFIRGTRQVPAQIQMSATSHPVQNIALRASEILFTCNGHE